MRLGVFERLFDHYTPVSVRYEKRKEPQKKLACVASTRDSVRKITSATVSIGTFDTQVLVRNPL
jgi:hypothetical protein